MQRNESAVRPADLANKAGVSTDTLRYYERLGLIGAPDRTPHGHRRYPSTALQRVLVIRRALSVGFTLEELARVFRARDAGRAPCREVRAMTAARHDEIGSRIAMLQRLRREISRLLRDWDRRLARTPSRHPAHLLENLTTEFNPKAGDGGCFAPLGKRSIQPPPRSKR